MRLTENKIRQIIREALSDRAPEFPPGIREKLITILTRLEPTMRREVEESADPSVRAYIALALDPDVVANAFGGNDEEAGMGMDVASDAATIALAENPPSAVRGAVKMINSLVWSRWNRGQGSSSGDADEMANQSDNERKIAIYLVSMMIPKSVAPEFIYSEHGMPKTMEEFVDALPNFWINSIFMARQESGEDFNQAMR